MRQEGPFDWRENYLTGEDMMAAGSPSPVYDSRSLAEIRSAAEDATNAEDGRLSPEQVNWHERARAIGLNVDVWRSVEQAVEEVRGCR